MRIQITARHTDVSESVRRRAEDRVTRLARFEPRLSAAELVFSEEKHLRKVEGILHVDGDETVVATADADQYRDAVDRLAEKLARRLRKRRARRREHKATPAREAGPE